MKFVALVLALALAGCATSRWGSVPPCNAWLILWGNADLTLDCPANPQPR